jgi:hypothetical protein
VASLTASGGEISDALRTLAAQGDGRTVTNYCRNGGFETNATGWTGVTRSTSSVRKSGNAAGVFGGGSPGSTYYDTGGITGPQIGDAFSASAWVYSANAGATLGATLENYQTSSSYNAFTLAKGWNRVHVTEVISTDTPRFIFYLDCSTPGLVVDDAQIEYTPGSNLARGNVHAYVPTDGANASAVGDGSYGVWAAATNLLTNGGAESGLTNILVAQGTGETLTRDQTIGKFGLASAKVVTNAAVSDQGLYFSSATGLALATGATVTGSVWVKGSGTVTCLTIITNTDTTTTVGTRQSIVLSSDWQRVTAPSLAVAAAKTGDKVWLSLRTGVGVSASVTINADGAQVEQKAYPTPYVHTDGAAATRSVGGLTMTAPAALSAAQGWFAALVRTGFASTVSGTHSILKWRDVIDNEHYQLYYDVLAGNGGWSMRRKQGGANYTISTAQSFSAGTVAFVAGKWGDPFGPAVSLNGGNWLYGPTGAAAAPGTLFGIGNNPLAFDTPFEGEILWAAVGTSYLPSNAELASLRSAAISGLSAPEQLQLGCLLIWTADDLSYNAPPYGSFSSSSLTRVQAYVDGAALEAVLPYVARNYAEGMTLTALQANYPALVKS